MGLRYLIISESLWEYSSLLTYELWWKQEKLKHDIKPEIWILAIQDDTSYNQWNPTHLNPSPIFLVKLLDTAFLSKFRQWCTKISPKNKTGRPTNISKLLLSNAKATNCRKYTYSNEFKGFHGSIKKKGQFSPLTKALEDFYIHIDQKGFNTFDGLIKRII